MRINSCGVVWPYRAHSNCILNNIQRGIWFWQQFSQSSRKSNQNISKRQSGTGVSQGLAQEGRTIFGWWVSECLALWHWSVVWSGTESIWMSKGLAFTLSWEARSNQIAGLRAIVQSDCRTACNHTIGPWGYRWLWDCVQSRYQIAVLRVIVQCFWFLGFG